MSFPRNGEFGESESSSSSTNSSTDAFPFLPSLSNQTFAYFFIFETSNLSLEEVDELYCSTSAAKSKKANHEMIARRTDLEGGHSVPVSDEADTADENKKELMTETA